MGIFLENGAGWEHSDLEHSIENTYLGSLGT